MLIGISGALALGAMSPGPSFVLVSRTAITNSRLNGLAAALGMGLGGAVLATLAVAGLSALLLEVGWLYFVLKAAGGLYLIYLGIRIWRGASGAVTTAEASRIAGRSLVRSFLLALVTQISNPKAIVVYGSIFMALLPASPPFWLLAVLPPVAFAIETLWYTVVAVAFSATRPRTFFLGFRGWVDRAAGALMGMLGARLILESVKSRF